MNLRFVSVPAGDGELVKRTGELATRIFREHFTPVLGQAQTEYMISLYYNPAAVRSQIEDGASYYLIMAGDAEAGFMALYPKDGAMYISKFYLQKEQRGRGYSHQMLDFITSEARAAGLKELSLVCNKRNDACQIYEKLGFENRRSVVTDIGGGFKMDDFEYGMKL